MNFLKLSMIALLSGVMITASAIQSIKWLDIKNTQADRITVTFRQNLDTSSMAGVPIVVPSASILRGLSWPTKKIALSPAVDLLPLGDKRRYDVSINVGSVQLNKSDEEMQALPDELTLTIDKEQIMLS